MNHLIQTAVVAAAVLAAGIADVATDAPAAKEVPAEVKREANSIEGQKIEEVKKVDAQAKPLTKVNKEILKPHVAQAVKGLDGIEGQKLENLKKALQLQKAPAAAAQPGTGGAAAAAGLLTGEQTAPPPPEPTPITDGRVTPELTPADQGGS
jgi:hypothetical protein